MTTGIQSITGTGILRFLKEKWIKMPQIGLDAIV
jgi:preprotein translocase subunit Sec61beta